MRYILDVPKVLKAIKVAEKAHKGQKRKVSGLPYFHHTVAVGFIVLSFKRSKHLTDIVVAGILHDTLEDTKFCFKKISKEFGPRVACLVLELTNDEQEIVRIGKKEYQKQKLLHMSSYALLIKLVDRLHNMSEHPTLQMKRDTQEILEELTNKRKSLTQAQLQLVEEIRKLCL